MNVSPEALITDQHISEDVLESYSMGKLSDEESAPMEEHLILCPVCRARLDETDEFIRATKAAASGLNPPQPGSPFRWKLLTERNIPRSVWVPRRAMEC